MLGPCKLFSMPAVLCFTALVRPRKNPHACLILMFSGGVHSMVFSATYGGIPYSKGTIRCYDRSCQSLFILFGPIDLWPFVWSCLYPFVRYPRLPQSFCTASSRVMAAAAAAVAAEEEGGAGAGELVLASSMQLSPRYIHRCHRQRGMVALGAREKGRFRCGGG